MNDEQRILAKERVSRLFRFIGELQQLSSPPNLNSKNYAWKCILGDLPKSKSVQIGKLAQGEDDVGDEFILRVKKSGEKKDSSGSTFEKFFDLHISLERESERLELLVADGLLSSPSTGVEHPVLLQKLNLEFVAESEELFIRETDREPELYLPALRKLGLSEAFISDWRLRLQNATAHPLGGDETSRFFAELQVAIQQQASEFPGVAADVALSRGAFLYLGPRTAAFTQAIDSYLEVLPTLDELPNSLSRIVGVESDSTGTIPEEPDLLLTMPSNPEQERVARRLAQTGAVLVQGPPGTGKTHTIANLVGHLLAQGKSVLVTSHASKALRVVRNMVIPELRPLCVSVLDQESDSRDQLESAVKGIVHRLTNSDVEELETLAKGYRHRRNELKETLHQLEHRLLQVRSQEYQPLRIGDEAVHPARAAQLLMDPASSAHTWLPGPVLSGAELPLTADEIRQLYKLNREVPLELEADLSQDLPPIEKLIPDYQFKELVNKKKALHTEEVVGEEFWEHDTQDPKQLQRLLETIDRAMAPISDGSAWILDCCRVSSLGGAHKQLWEDLLVAIETSANQFATLERRKLATGAEISCDLPLEEQQRTITEIINYLKNKGSITFWTYMNASWKKILGCARIHGSNQPKTVEDCEGVLACIQLEILQQSLQNRWDRQMGAKGAPIWKDLGPVPHEMAFSYTAQIRACLNWHHDEWEVCRKAMKESGLRWSSMVDRVSIDTGLYGELFRIRECVRKYLIPTIHSRRADLDSSVYDQRLKSQEVLLAEYAPKDLGGILGRLKAATQQLDVDGYARAWAWFTQLQSLEDPARRRNLLLSKLESSAPGWVEALREHRQPHDRADAPGDAAIAWRFRQWTQQLEERNEEDPDQLQQEVLHVRSQLRLATAQYVENITWANQLKRTGVKQQQALVGWLDLMKKIGSGKGKRAPKLRQTAREKLAECRDAVPVWIMPLARVAENYHPGKSKFDVVILDEASQSDVTGLLAFALGKEVLVVGDNEQVSPDAVGMSYEKVEALIAEHLFDIPNKELYDGKTSVYDLARQSFGGTIRLVEHFRCVPDIIAFSNRLCYQGEIQPLRDDSKTSLRPSVRLHTVQGGSYNRKVNRTEAEEVASLVISCCQQPEYKGKTFGVVSLVGEEQAQYIDKLLTTHLPLAEYHERRILCGNAAQFQGDERDVVFLSTVETSEDSGSLSLRRTEVFVKRYNVAASRAKDQLWVVTSLDPDQDLKPGDLREQLIRHAQDPKKTLADVAEMNQQSRSYNEFVASGHNRMISDVLRDELDRGGYTAKTNYSIGNYTLDLIVESASGRVAIKCDGDREIAGERFKQAVDREAVLERLGWRFIRLRASQYYLNPQKTIQLVIRRLQLMGLEPLKEAMGVSSEQIWAELHQRILFRASQIRRTWSGEAPVDTTGIVSHSEVEVPVETFFSVEKFLSGRDSVETPESDFLRLPPTIQTEVELPQDVTFVIPQEPVAVEVATEPAAIPEKPAETSAKPKPAWRDLLNLTKRPTPTVDPSPPAPADGDGGV